MTHDEADQMCRQDNTNLVSIHSYEEHKWLFGNWNIILKFFRLKNKENIM